MPITAQSGDAVTNEGQRIRRATDVAMCHGFDVAANPPGGAEAPPGLCQEVFGVELCTIALQLP